MTELPLWIDERLSAELPVLRARGEGQDLEYMEGFPTQARDLAKEIAAFATSNPGVILLGVANNGDLVGLSASTPEQRDSLVRRIEGICRGTVQPAITPTVAFAVEDDKVVLVIRVPKGLEPVYYCGNVPYVRHLTESRPAEPHEVVQLIRAAVAFGVMAPRAEDPVGSALAEFLRALASVLRDLLLYADEVESRSLHPALDSLMSTFGGAATELRELALAKQAQQLGVDALMNELALKADAVAHYRHALGRSSWERFTGLVRDARALADTLWGDQIAPRSLSKDLVASALEEFDRNVQLLVSLAGRADEMIDQGRLKELVWEATIIGGYILRLAYFGLHHLDENLLREVKEIAHSLHLVEARRFALGGREVSALKSDLERYSSRLAEIRSAIM